MSDNWIVLNWIVALVVVLATGAFVSSTLGCTKAGEHEARVRADVDHFIEQLDLQKVRCFFDFANDTKKARCVATTASNHSVYFECGTNCRVYELVSVPPGAERE